MRTPRAERRLLALGHRRIAFLHSPDKLIVPRRWDIQALQADDIIGPGFEPNDMDFIFGTRSTVDPTEVDTRGAGWGDWPAAYSSNLLIQVRAVGRTQDGNRIRSNWVVHPVEVCASCLGGLCKALFNQTCEGSTETAIQGEIPSGCPASQGYRFSCVEVDECSTTSGP